MKYSHSNQKGVFMDYETCIQEMIKLLELKGCTTRTIELYAICIRKLLTTLDKPVDEITTDDLMSYIYQMISRKLGNNTINQNHSIIIFFFTHVLRKHHLIIPIPFMRRVRKLPEILTPDEIQEILKSASSFKYKTIFMTLYSSGLRISEVLRLRISDIDSKKMQLRIQQGKGRKDRYTILSKENLKCLREYYRIYQPEDLLFFGYSYKDKPLSINTVEKEFRIAVRATKIKKKATPHSLRHAFASHLLENGADIYAIKALLGHSTLRSTEIYLQLAPTKVFDIKSPMDQVPTYE